MDRFTRPENELPMINGTPNWEVPESVDYSKIMATIKIASINHEFIIVEGILIYANEALNKLYDCTIYLELSKNTYLTRRKHEKRWGEEPAWYQKYVWEAYRQFGRNGQAMYTLSGERPITDKELVSIAESIRAGKDQSSVERS